MASRIPTQSPFLLAARFLFPLTQDTGPNTSSDASSARITRGESAPVTGPVQAEPIPVLDYASPGPVLDSTGPLAVWTRTARWLPLWGLAIGILYAILYRGTWKWFGEYQKLRLLPATALLIFDFCWFGYRQLAASIEILARKQLGTARDAIGLAGVLAVLLIGLFKFSMLLVLPAGAYVWPADWRQYLGILYPSVIYRPLVLMPLWGRWAMLLALCIGRVSPGGTDRLRYMAGGARLTVIFGWWFLITLLTVGYSSPDLGHLQYGLVIALAVLVVAYLAGFALARRFDGQTETTIAAAGMVGELAFLMFYLPVARAIYWY